MIARILLLASALLLANTLHAAEKVQSFQVRGVVRELRPDKKEMVIKHETIPGYMEAMVMPFTVRESKSFKHVKPGDRVTFRLNVTDAADWIESITVEGHDKARPNTDGEHRNGIKEGDAFPFRDYDLIDSMGKAFKLEKLKGSPVAVTFFFYPLSDSDDVPSTGVEIRTRAGTHGGGRPRLVEVGDGLGFHRSCP